MDRDLEEQINDLINKSNKDLKTRIVRIVVRHQNKLLKDQARDLKTNNSSRNAPVTSRNTTSKDKKSNSTKSDTKYSLLL